MVNKLMTLCFIFDDKKMLLGMKKRGFGVGRWNGFGGKVHDGESIHDTAIRELKEEISISVDELQKQAILYFEFDGDPQKFEVHVFRIIRYSGVITESEEMKPEWFDINKIPYDSMWTDDKYWLPKFILGEKFVAETKFKNEDEVLSFTIKESGIVE